MTRHSGIRRIYDFECDSCGEFLRVPEGTARGQMQANAYAREQGWKIGRECIGSDTCPDCLKKKDEETR